MAARVGTHYAYRTPHGLVTIATSDRGVHPGRLRRRTASGRATPERAGEPHGHRAAGVLRRKKDARSTCPWHPQAPRSSWPCGASWNAIPYGETLTTADVAALLDKPSSYRAVGNAVHKNPLAVLVPDHRIVGAGGAPLGANARLRGALLALERASAGEGS